MKEYKMQTIPVELGVVFVQDLQEEKIYVFAQRPGGGYIEETGPYYINIDYTTQYEITRDSMKLTLFYSASPTPTTFKITLDFTSLLEPLPDSGIILKTSTKYKNGAETYYTSINGINLAPFGGEYTDNNEWVFAPICVHEDTLVTTINNEIKIKDIRKGDIVIDNNNNKHIVVSNIKSIKASEFIEIKKDAFGENIPKQDLLITSQHPILVDNIQVEPQNIINNTTITKIVIEPVTVYSLLTKEKVFIMMNNIPVSTWCVEDYAERVKKQGFAYELL